MSTDQVAKALEYIRELPESKRECVQALLLQVFRATEQEKFLFRKLADKEKQLAKLEADKKEQLAKLEADKAVLLDNSRVFIQDKTKLEGEVLALQGKLHAIEAMRPLVEILSRMAYPSFTSTTQSVQILCTGLIEGSEMVGGKPVFGNQLTAQAQAWLSQLEIQPIDPKSMTNELKDLYHELSKNLHVANMTGNALSSGLVCGGKLPLRAAVALAILEAQRLLADKPGELPKEDIYYLDEKGRQLHVLRKGMVVEE